MKDAVDSLLSGVAWRQRLAAILAQLWPCWWAVSCAYLLLLLLSRLLGLIPPWFTSGSLAIIPLLALLAALALYRRPSRLDAARLVDARTAAKDLFLTACTVAHSLGEYQDLVLAEAARRAAAVRPAEVLRWVWRRNAALAAGSLILLYWAGLALPQFDPFGRQQERKRMSVQQAQLKDAIKATALRSALLAQGSEAYRNPIAQTVAELQKIFNTAKPADKTGTFNRLHDAQKALGELWRKASDERLRDALNRAASLQNFGLNDSARAQQLRSDLEKGDLRSTERELEALQALARQLANAADTVRREELRQELADRLQSLRETLAQQTNSSAVDAAIQRALEQLQMSCQKGLSSEALKGLAASLKLTTGELDRLAGLLRDLRDLEEALKAIQSAKRLHGLNPLDGQACTNCNAMCDYAALFDALYASACGAGDGKGPPGMGMGPGQGIGPRPYGDDNAVSAFTPRQSPSAFQPGQVLLSWKSREISDPGRAREDFRQAVQALRQEASEAVLEERIPASYHPAIKTYFDTLNNESAQPVQP